jgi:hypothetical protein
MCHCAEAKMEVQSYLAGLDRNRSRSFRLIEKGTGKMEDHKVAVYSLGVRLFTSP